MLNVSSIFTWKNWSTYLSRMTLLKRSPEETSMLIFQIHIGHVEPFYSFNLGQLVRKDYIVNVCFYVHNIMYLNEVALIQKWLAATRYSISSYDWQVCITIFLYFHLLFQSVTQELVRCTEGGRWRLVQASPVHHGTTILRGEILKPQTQ